MSDSQTTDLPTTVRRIKAAHDIWSRMNSLWATKQAYQAVKEMGRLLKREGWVE